MKQPPFALILRGTSGSGKTTVSRKISVKYKAIILEHDMFMFRLLRYGPASKEHFEAANHALKCIFDYAIGRKKNLVLDGALVSIDRTINKFSIASYIRALEKNGYHIVQVMFRSTHEEAKRRMGKRRNVVSASVYKKLRNQLNKSVRPEEIVVNTSKKTKKQLFSLMIKLIEAN